MILVSVAVAAVTTGTWIALSVFPDPLWYGCDAVLWILLVGFLFVNLFIFTRRLNGWSAHGAAAVLIVITLLFKSLLFYCAICRHKEWFFHTGIRRYEAIVNVVASNKASLTSKHSSLDVFFPKSVGADLHIWGHTNADGSMTVEMPFPNHLRGHGYLYYDGHGMIVNPRNTNMYTLLEDAESNPSLFVYRHITNCWYEF